MLLSDVFIPAFHVELAAAPEFDRRALFRRDGEFANDADRWLSPFPHGRNPVRCLGLRGFGHLNTEASVVENFVLDPLSLVCVRSAR